MKHNIFADRITSTEQRGTRRIYHVGPRFEIEITTVKHDLTNRSDLMRIWRQAGYIANALPSSLAVNTYYTDESGNCWGRYNCTEKPSEDGRRRVIDFDYLREATPGNEFELVAECIRRAVEAGAI